MTQGHEAMGRDRLRGLVDMARVLGGARSHDQVLRLSAAAARTAMAASSVTLTRWEWHSGRLRVLVRSGALGPDQGGEPVDESYSLSDHPRLALATGVSGGHAFSLIGDEGDPFDRLLIRAEQQHGMLVPIVLEGRTWGELVAFRAGDPAFNDDDVDFGMVVAAQIAAGLASAGHVEDVSRLAYTDSLTGLANRRALDDRLDDAMDRHRTEGMAVGLLLCDVNGLKQVNDSDGHAVGDGLLMDVARLLAAASAEMPNSLAARMGGDEFCVLGVGAPADTVVAAAERLRRAAEALPVGRGVSVGVACTDDPVGHADTPKRLLRLADAAQYRAKRSGVPHPVVAGRRLPAGGADAVAPPTDQPQARRRAFRGPVPDGVALLAAGLRQLDENPGEPITSRLEAVADLVSRSTNAASWVVSHVAPGGDVLRTVGYSVLRIAASDPRPEAVLVSPEAVYPLADYPWSAAAVRGGGYEVDAGDPGHDPAEVAILAESGYLSAVAAGATSGEGGWLVEIFHDETSTRHAGLLPVLRALVAVATSPAASGLSRK